MNRQFAWGIGAGIGAVALWGGLFYGRSKQLDADDWAAWVQAIGSVVAILVAVAVADFHVRSERQAQREQQKSLTSRVTLAVRNLGLAAHKLRQHAREQNATDAAFLSRFGNFVATREDAVLGAPIWTIEDSDVVQHLLVIQAAIGDCRHLRSDNPARLADNLDILVRRSRDYLKVYGAPVDLEQLAD